MVLTLGSRGTDVQDYQKKLIAAGFNPGIPDGIFGQKTLAAEKLFVSSLITFAPPTLGSRGTDVQDYQKKLIAAGFNPGIPDGIFGQKTLAAEKLFVNSLITFAPPISRAKVNPILLRRVALWLYDNKLKATRCFGYRATSDQARLYKAWIAYKNYKANPSKYPKAPAANPAASPGNSWHEFHLAVDLQGPGIRELITRTILPFSRNKQPCNKWGISFTMNKVDAPSQLEWWHVVTTETANYRGDRSKFILKEGT